jgi:hypothetical protein
MGASPPAAICARPRNENSSDVRKYRFSDGVYLSLYPLFLICLQDSLNYADSNSTGQSVKVCLIPVPMTTR